MSLTNFKNIILLFLFLLFNNLIYSQKKVLCDIKLDDCINCYKGLSFLNKLDPSVELTFILPEKDSIISDEIIQSFNISRKYSLIFVDSKGSNKNFSKIYFTVKDILIKSMDLREVQQNIEFINNYVSENNIEKNKDATASIKKKLEKNLKVNIERLNYFTHKNYIALSDYILDKAFLMKTMNDSVKILKELTSSQFSPELFLPQIPEISKSTYYSLFDKLKEMGESKPKFNSVYISDSTFYMMIDFTAPIIENPDTVLIPWQFMYEYNFYTGNKKLVRIKTSMLHKNYKGYDIDNTAQFYVKNNKYYFQIFHYEPQSQDSVSKFSEWEITQNVFQLKKLSSPTFNRTERGYLKTDSSVTGSTFLNSEFMYFNIRGFLFDLKSNIKIQLDKEYFDVNKYIKDIVKLQNGNLQILLSDYKKTEYIDSKVIEYNIKQNKIIRTINYKDIKPRNSTLRFFDTKTIFYLNPDLSSYTFIKVN